MAEETVREQMAGALEEIAKGEGRFNRDHLIHCENTVENMKAIAVAALDRHRAALEWRSQCCGAAPHEASPDVGVDNPVGFCGGCRENTVFERAEPEEPCHCKANECGPECPCYQAGLGAQRERVGGGTEEKA